MSRPPTRGRVLAMYPHLIDDIPAIEAEAIATERARLRALVEGLRQPAYGAAEFHEVGPADRNAMVNAVLALLDEQR